MEIFKARMRYRLKVLVSSILYFPKQSRTDFHVSKVGILTNVKGLGFIEINLYANCHHH